MKKSKWQRRMDVLITTIPAWKKLFVSAVELVRATAKALRNVKD